MNSDLSESRLAAMVHELRSGGNSKFQARLEALLRVPWFHESGVDGRPQFYDPCHTAPDIRLTLTRWDD